MIQDITDSMRDLSIESAARGGRRSHPTDNSFSSVVATTSTGASATVPAVTASAVTGSSVASGVPATAVAPNANDFETRLREQAVDISAQDRYLFS